MKVYLAGKMSGIEKFNFPEFARIAKRLRKAGYTVFSPHEEETLPGTDEPDPNKTSQPLPVLLLKDMPHVLNSDGVVAMPNWKDSTGAQFELTVAWNCGKQVLEYADPSLPNWRNEWFDGVPQSAQEEAFVLLPMVRPTQIIVAKGNIYAE